MNIARYHLSNSYPKLLGAFGSWAAVGIALMLLGTGQYIFGGVLAVGAAGMLVLAIRGGRNAQRAYSRLDLVIQWMVLAVPVILAINLLVLAFAFFRPFTAYVAIYLVVLVILGVFIARELLRKAPAS